MKKRGRPAALHAIQANIYLTTKQLERLKKKGINVNTLCQHTVMQKLKGRMPIKVPLPFKGSLASEVA